MGASIYLEYDAMAWLYGSSELPITGCVDSSDTDTFWAQKVDINVKEKVRMPMARPPPPPVTAKSMLLLSGETTAAAGCSYLSGWWPPRFCTWGAGSP